MTLAAILLFALGSAALIGSLDAVGATSKTRRQWAWRLFPVAASVLPVALECWTATSATDNSDLLHAFAGGLWVAAAILCLRLIADTIQWSSRTVLLRHAGAVLLVLTLGVFSRSAAIASRHGWYAATPVSVLVVLARWLPEDVFHNPGSSRPGTIESRLGRDELNAWNHYWLRRELRARYAASDSVDDYRLLAKLVPEHQIWQSTPEKTLNVAARPFTSSTDPHVLCHAARVLDQFSPFGGKISYPDIGREHGALAFAGTLDRLIDLSNSSDYQISSTAVESLVHLHKESGRLVPYFLQRLNTTPKVRNYSEELAVGFLLQVSPSARLCALDLSGATSSNDLDLAALLTPGPHNAPLIQAFAHLIRSSSDEQAALAAEFATYSLRHADQSARDSLVIALLDQAASERSNRLTFITRAFDLCNAIERPYVQCIADLLADDSPEVRIAVCREFAKERRFPWQSVRDFLVKRIVPLRGDPSPEVRAAAEEALWAIEW